MADCDQYQESYTNFLNHNPRSSQMLRMSTNDDYEDSPPAKIANIGKYPVVQDNGHRRFGPPIQWIGEAPQRGCEVFIGKIPRDCLEDELIPVFETIGPIYEFRLMVDFNGINRGYGFCVYQNKEDSIKAVEKLNNYEIRPGKAIGVCFSVDNCRLFVGGIPKNKTKEEILSEMQRVTSGVVDVIAYPSIANKNKNRGFAFVEYESHKSAAVARRKLIPGRIPLWGQQIAVDWAEPEREVHETIMSTVKILYARNLMLSTTEETLREKFLSASEGPYTCIERVKKMKDYAFIHFTERLYAENAKNALNNANVDGSIIEVTWAKPADKSQFKQTKSVPVNNDFSIAELAGTTQIYFDPNTGLSYIGPAMTNWSNSLNLLSDNNFRNKVTRRNAAGSKSTGSSKEKRPQPIEYLEELANAYNWGTPQYSTSVSEMDRGESKTQLFNAQVYIPNLNIKQATQVLHSTSEEAKSAAAELFIKSVTQPPNPYSSIDVRQQMAILQTLGQMQVAGLINPTTGSFNHTQPSLDINPVTGAPLYYLQPGLANSSSFNPSSLLPSSQQTQLNLAAFNNLYSNANPSLSALINSPPIEGNSIGHLFSTPNGLNILSSANPLSILPMNMDTGHGDLDNSALRSLMFASQLPGYLYNTQQGSNDPNTLLMNQQVNGQ